MSAEPPDPRARLFVAIELPELWTLHLAALRGEQERLSPGYFRWVRPELFHLTVLFIGERPEDTVPAVGEALGRAVSECRAFELELGRVGTFGRPGSPSVLWVEARDVSGQLARLRQHLEDELTRAEVVFDEKPLRPHITLARARSRAGSCRAVLQRAVHVPPHLVEQVTLVESRLGPGGPAYNPRARVELAKI